MQTLPQTPGKWNVKNGDYSRDPEHTNKYQQQKKKKARVLFLIKLGGVIIGGILLALILLYFTGNL